MPTSAQHGSGAADATGRYRLLILALIMVGAAGLLAELVLIEHYDEVWQWAPLTALGATIVTGAVVAWRPTRHSLRVFQGVMVACVLFGAIGIVLHLKGNLEFELESAPGLTGWPLYEATIRGATPALAPGALTQLGLLGLLYCFRHPAGARSAGAHRTSTMELS